MASSLQPAHNFISRVFLPYVCICFAAIGCASPGPPRAPTLNLPQPVQDLTATRTGDTVELRFTVPSTSTDKLPLRGTQLDASFCRELDHQTCIPIASSHSTIPTPAPLVRSSIFIWTDILPSEITQGKPRVLGYRVELTNASGRSAGNSYPAFTAAGSSPTPLEALHVEGSRLGVVLHWTAASSQPGDILFDRQDLAAQNSKAVVVHLIAPAATPPPSTLLDPFAKAGQAYRYTASRRLTVQLGGRSVELRSAPSSPVDITLATTYPPLAPTGLTAAAYFVPASSTPIFAVDLIWQPVDETGAITPLAGYNLYREILTPIATTPNHLKRLNPTPISQPAFHDTTADPTARYRYTVTAVDAKGNESGPASALLEPTKP